ncbi:MAG: amidohydrolase, partial [Rhodothermales bacterium]
MIRLLLAAILFACAPLCAAAQDEALPVVTRTTAITNARIVQAPGRVIERGTVVMRNGLIVAVGSDVQIPYDAEIVKGDSLIVYAGFVDGLSHAGVSGTASVERPPRLNAADPPADYAGLQPQRSARELLNPSDTLASQLRKLGFTTAHVVPRGRMLPGGGSIILLAGDAPEEMVLRPDVSQFMQFESGTGVYPNTQMGIMAQLRQLLREAKRRERIQTLYAENP